MGSFKIDVIILGGMSPSQKKVFEEAARRWGEVIQGPSLTLRLSAQGRTIDGPGRVLGQAGPTQLRTSDGLPISGIMEFDTADLNDMEYAGTLKAVILHEMGHVLGIGTLWERNGLVQGAGTNDPRYIGKMASKEYSKLLGSKTSVSIPVENTGGPGTAGGHWRESTLDEELMTGYAEDGSRPMPLSRITVAALEDLGYSVSYKVADPYQIPKLQPALVGTASIKKTKKKSRRYCHSKVPHVEVEKVGCLRRWCCCCCCCFRCFTCCCR
jgi:hypothetical protein